VLKSTGSQVMTMYDPWAALIAERLMAIYRRRFDAGSAIQRSVILKFDSAGFPEYMDPDRYEDNPLIDHAASRMEKEGHITINREKFTKLIKSVSLVTDNIDSLCEVYGIEHPYSKYTALFKCLDQHQDTISLQYRKEILNRLDQKKSIKSHLIGMEELDHALTLIEYAQKNDMDVLERNLSVRLFSDSKRIQAIKGKADLVIRTVLDADGTQWLQEQGIMKNPGHVYLKGKGRASIDGQPLVLDQLKGSIALESALLGNVVFENIGTVYTVENLTTFHTFNEPGLIIYLGGFSNHAKIQLLGKLSHVTHDFRHFGDIDYGGFMIIDHLIRSTGIDIKPYRMDIGTLKRYGQYCKHIGNDHRYMHKLESLLSLETLASLQDTIRYMISNKVILEQEAIVSSGY
jgi:hypothetical protein